MSMSSGEEVAEFKLVSCGKFYADQLKDGENTPCSYMSGQD